jgi:RNA polymerase sigma-70 factor (ECF subfamily)
VTLPHFDIFLAAAFEGDDERPHSPDRDSRRPCAVAVPTWVGTAATRAMSKADETKVLEALRSQSDTAAHGAFNAIYYAYAESLWRFATRLTGSAADAEEMVHDVFAHVWTHRTTVAAPGGIAAYLFRAVRNQAIDTHRHNNVVSRIGADPSAPVPGLGEAPEDPDAQLLARELVQALHRAIDGLPERRRTALTLRYIHAMSYAQIASVLEISEKAAFILVARTRESLRTLFDQFVAE